MGNLDLTDRELSAYWMPFTHNRYFKQHHARRVLAKAEGSYYWTTEGEKLFDALSGLWCCGLGHRHPKIVEAVKQQLPQAGAEETSEAPQAAASKEPMKQKTPRVNWAELLRRTFAIDVFACVRCGGRRRVRADVNEAGGMPAILEHLGLPTAGARLAPAREPL
jgi:hypothetical protein